MDVDNRTARWEAELRALREELGALRAEQHQIAQSVKELTQTFRSLALQLGIAAEPYAKGKKEASRDLPGFA
jgi:prefoldin subunit 5